MPAFAAPSLQRPVPLQRQLQRQQQHRARAPAAAAPARAAAIGEGARVRVAAPVTVFHLPKFKEGLQLQGLEGEVQANVGEFQGATLSANLPLRVALAARDAEGKEVKVVAHLVGGWVGGRGVCARVRAGVGVGGVQGLRAATNRTHRTPLHPTTHPPAG